jgi:hypothetical protein
MLNFLFGLASCQAFRVTHGFAAWVGLHVGGATFGFEGANESEEDVPILNV